VCRASRGNAQQAQTNDALLLADARRYVAVKAMKQHFSTVEKVSKQVALGSLANAELTLGPPPLGVGCSSAPATAPRERLLLSQVNNLREIQALRRLSPHPNIVSLLEVLYDRPSGRLALVFELMSMNLYDLIRGRDHYLDNGLIRIYLFQ